ncbi:hypothetical protein F4801DRAFT_572017 [Xylaria longipes]|nr:hypothetical protein F4801DRAFT_572017 [Xylaria longipes]
MAQNNSEGKGRLYFAYGSNLSTTQMQDRCPHSTPIGLAHLTGWTWIINERGFANIVRNGYRASLQRPDAHDQVEVNDGYDPSWDQPLEIIPGTGVYGLVYLLHPTDVEKLDRYEGVGYAYEKEMLDAVWADVSNSNAGPHSSSIATDASLKAESKQPTEEIERLSREVITSRVPGEKFQALVYVDSQRTTPSGPKEEYIGRMNVGIKEASERWGMPRAYVDEVIRPYIPAASDANQVAVTN